MSFTKPGPLVGYVTGDLIDEADINYWCSKFPDCIDGAGGGSYTLSAPLSITGDAVEIEEAEIESLTVNGQAVFNDDLTCNDLAYFADSIDVVNGVFASNVQAATGRFTGALQFLFKTSMGPNADTTYNHNDAGQIIFVESMTADRAYTLSGSFVAGHWFLFKHRSSGGTTLTINGSAYTIDDWALWVYNGSFWRTFQV